MNLAAHGLQIQLPRGWSGRVFSRSSRVATLHVGSFPIALSDGEFGDRSTARLPPGGAFIALTEYRPGDGLEPGKGLFARHKLPLPLDPANFARTGLAHPRPGQSGVQHFFTASGRPLCLYVVLGPTAHRRRQLASVDHVLRSLQIERRV